MASGSKTIPVFRPTMEEFTGGFSNYVTHIQPSCSEFGLAKIIPPKEWNPERHKPGWFDKEVKRVTIPAPIHQYLNGMKGIFQQTNVADKPMKLAKFRKLAEEAKKSRSPATTDEEIERRFWKNIRFEPPLYGADMRGSLFPKDLFDWNVARLTEQNLLKYIGAEVDGVNNAYLYFGMWKAMFSWHTEDMDLFSINYLHHGEPKRWYCVPESERFRFEQFAASHFHDLEQICKPFLRHKTTMISPTILKNSSISVYTGVQREGEFMITFPGSYHAGFNHGFNCAESLNFAIDSWISRGLKATICQCKPENVRINMKIFLHNYNLSSENGEVNQVTPITQQPPTYVLDHIETEKEDILEPISIKIQIPGTSKGAATPKKKKKRKNSQERRKTSNSPAPRAKKQKVNGPTSWLSLGLLDVMESDSMVPSSLVPECLIECYTSLQ